MAQDGEEVRRTPTPATVTISKAQLEHLQKVASVGAVASSVAHEFNNILTAILNHAKLGMRGESAESKDRSFDKILTAARRAAKITTGVLALSRNRTARREPTDLATLVEEVLSVVQKDLEKHQVRVEKDFRATPPAPVVPSQIEQVLMNVLINARQAMPRGGTLRIGVRMNADTDMAEISIQDSGVGIAPDKINRIFDPFFSTKEGPDDSGQGGSGLGLSICREIIERHQGRIRVESTVGKGTAFTIKLPITTADETAVALAAAG